MSRVLAEVAGKLATWLGYDGTDFRNVHVDAAGNVQVDVLTSAINALAATAANQVTMITALELIDNLQNALDTIGSDALRVMGGIDGIIYRFLHVDGTGDVQTDVLSSALPTGAATAAHQVSMVTALQLIDDLRGALDSVGTDELDVNVEASVLPTGAATSAWQDTLNDGVVTLQDNFPTGGKWKRENRSANIPDTTWTDLVSMTVPAGKVHYWMGVIGGPIFAPSPWAIKLFEGAGTISEFWVTANPFTMNIGQIVTRAAAGTYKVQAYQSSGGAMWMGGMMTYIEVPA